MNTYTKKHFWMLLLIFCFLILFQGVNTKGAAAEKKEEHIIVENENIETEERSGRYITIYINETFSIQIDLIFIMECIVLLFVFVLEKAR